MALIGFLTMLFIGFSLISRTLEGAFIAAADVTIANQVLVFTPYSVFGFPVPLPNVNYIVGLKELINWNYGFFGGQAAIIQYLMYSISAALTFVLFTIAFGLAASWATRVLR